MLQKKKVVKYEDRILLNGRIGQFPGMPVVHVEADSKRKSNARITIRLPATGADSPHPKFADSLTPPHAGSSLRGIYIDP